MKRSPTKYAYHGTLVARIVAIRDRGLKPGAAPRYDDSYSEYDDGKHLFLLDKEHSAEDYGNITLRVPWPRDAKPDKNKYGRMLPGQFVSKLVVKPEHIKVRVGKRWVPIDDVSVRDFKDDSDEDEEISLDDYYSKL